MNALSMSTSQSDEFDPEPASGAMRIPVTRAEMEPYLGLVHQVVARVMRRLPRSVDRDDLLAAGSYGLMDALRRSTGERGDRFEAYARIRIRGAVIDELRSQDWLARSARAHATAEVRSNDRAATGTFVGLDDLPLSERDLPSTGPSPFELVAGHAVRSVVDAAVQSLPRREAEILDLHYFPGVQFKDIATQMKVSDARVSQLHSRALGMLRPMLAATLAECA
jgi:RNA polymerase sigma factor for flagellar operon FliA